MYRFFVQRRHPLGCLLFTRRNAINLHDFMRHFTKFDCACVYCCVAKVQSIRSRARGPLCVFLLFERKKMHFFFFAQFFGSLCSRLQGQRALAPHLGSAGDFGSYIFFQEVHSSLRSPLLFFYDIVVRLLSRTTAFTSLSPKVKL